MFFYIFYLLQCFFFFFFFNDTATTEIYTLSLHDALPISLAAGRSAGSPRERIGATLAALLSDRWHLAPILDRKSTRLNSSHDQISYAVFCLKKKKKKKNNKKYYITK